MAVGSKQLNFLDFLLETLKVCLPLFCEFLALLVRTNCGFKSIGQDFVPLNLLA